MVKKKQTPIEHKDISSEESGLVFEDELDLKITETTPKTIYDELVKLIGSEIDLNKYPEYDNMYFRLKGKYFKNSCEDCKPRMLYEILKIYIRMFYNNQIKAEDYK